MEGEFGLVEAVRQLITDFRSGWYIGLAGVFYLLIQVLRGKTGYSIPWVTDKFNGIQSKFVKTAIILGLFGISGALASFGLEKVTFASVFNAFLGGIGLGLGTVGFRQTAKAGLEDWEARKTPSEPAGPEPKPENKQ